MEIFNNTTKVVKDDLEKTIRQGSRVSIAAACFSIYAYQELKSFLTAAGENLSTSSPLPVPAVALVCPVEVCPIRNRRQVPLGNLFIRLPFTMTPITIPFSSFKGSTSAIATVSLLAAASVSIRHTAPVFPSYWLIIG